MAYHFKFSRETTRSGESLKTATISDSASDSSSNIRFSYFNLYSSRISSSSEIILKLMTCNASMAVLWKPLSAYAEKTWRQVDGSGRIFSRCIFSTISSSTPIFPWQFNFTGLEQPINNLFFRYYSAFELLLTIQLMLGSEIQKAPLLLTNYHAGILNITAGVHQEPACMDENSCSIKLVGHVPRPPSSATIMSYSNKSNRRTFTRYCYVIFFIASQFLITPYKYYFIYML